MFDASRLHPLLLDPTPVWPEDDDYDDLRAARGVMLSCILGTLFWIVFFVVWAWLVWLT